MDDKRRFYWVLTIVFAAAVGLIILLHFFPVWHVVNDLAGISAVGALFGALFQLARDRIAHERAAQLEESKNRFTIGATSHMASVTFDKHVAFAEEYVEEMTKALVTVFGRGPLEEVLQHRAKLEEIRFKWLLWQTPEVYDELGTFEDAIQRVGAEAAAMPAPVAQNYGEYLRQIYEEFAELVGLGAWGGTKISKEGATEKALTKLRQVLGVDELTHVRRELVKRALENLKD